MFVYSMSNYTRVFDIHTHAYHFLRQGQGKKNNDLLQKWQRQSWEIAFVIIIIYQCQISLKDEKYGTAREPTDDNMKRRIRSRWWRFNDTDTHSEYVILLLFNFNNGQKDKTRTKKFLQHKPLLCHFTERYIAVSTRNINGTSGANLCYGSYN